MRGKNSPVYLCSSHYEGNRKICPLKVWKAGTERKEKPRHSLNLDDHLKKSHDF